MRPLFRNTVGPIRDQIRPFARDVQKPLRHVKQLAKPLAETSTGLTKSFSELNRFFNALAYNPPGTAQEGYLFWLSWLNHNTNALFFTQDAGGPLRHGLVLLSCATAVARRASGTPPRSTGTCWRSRSSAGCQTVDIDDPPGCPSPPFDMTMTPTTR